MSFHSPYVDLYDKTDESPVEPAPLFSVRSRPDLQSPSGPEQQQQHHHITSEERRPSASTIANPGQRYGLDSPTFPGTVSSERVPTINETAFPEQRTLPDRSRSVAVRTPAQTSSGGGHSPSALSGTTQAEMAGMSRTVSASTKKSGFIGFSSDKKEEKKEEKKEGRSLWNILSRKESRAQPVETSSISSNTLEQQKLEQISLKPLLASARSHGGPAGKPVHVHLPSVSTQALFWTEAAMQIWDVGTSPPTCTRTISTESTCILAAVAKTYLAYITGPREQKLTVWARHLSPFFSPANYIS